MWDERSPKETQREREYRREILDERDALERKIEGLEADNVQLRTERDQILAERDWLIKSRCSISDREAAMEHIEYVLAIINRELTAERDRAGHSMEDIEDAYTRVVRGGNHPSWVRIKAALTQREGGEA